MSKFFSILLVSLLISSSSAFARDDNARNEIIKVANPFANFLDINPELLKAAEFYDAEGMTHAEIDAKSLALYEASINKDSLTKTERSILLKLRTTLYHEEDFIKNPTLKGELRELSYQIIKLNALPSEDLSYLMRTVSYDSYLAGETNIATNAYLQAIKMGYKPRPWDHYILAELLVQLGRTDLALKKLEDVNSLLLDEGCEVPAIWQEAYEKVKENDLDYLELLKKPSAHLYQYASGSRLKTIKRVAARYTQEAAYKSAAGWIHFSYLVGADGKVNCIFATDGEVQAKEFIRAARRALSKYKFQIDITDWDWPITSGIIMKFHIRNDVPAFVDSQKHPNIQ